MSASFLKYILILVATLTLSLNAKAQETIDYDYGSEFVWGVTKATNSGRIGGFILRYAIAVDDDKYQHFGLELVNIKDPKETRYSNTMTSGKSYISKKQNYLYNLRLQYGREWVLFRKAQYQGVQVNGILSGGFSMGMLTPYYYEYSDGTTGTYKAHNDGNIIGYGKIFEGVPEMKIVPGAHLKAALSFEFGAFKSSVFGFEGGFMIEGYTKRNYIMVPGYSKARQIYPNAFITLFYGSRK